MNYREILKEYWGFDNFRGIQQDIIESIGSGHDTLGLMPTGGGKSITFQVPAMAKQGLCLVITPLIALMKDQVANLRARGIKAAAIYSGLSRQEVVVTMENCIFGGYKFLYVSPERLQSDFFRLKIRHVPVSMITIDEAHCISQWGYDFRPSYLQIAEIRKIFPEAPLLALTATATPQVVQDIQQQLQFKKENVFKMSFERNNLCYVVRPTDNKAGEMLHILGSVAGSAIIYTRNRKQTKDLSALLQKAGFTAEYYHAGLSNREKDEREKRWKSGTSRIMVATNAFGMGIDKPDVRLVIHWEMPDSIEAYFQEAGRGGRDGKKAYAVLLFTQSDKRITTKRISDNYPPEEFIRTAYNSLSYYYQMAVGDGLNCTYTFSLPDFCQKYHLPTLQTDSALRILTRMGYIEYVEEMEYSARLMFTVTRDDLYRLHTGIEAADRLITATLRRYSGLFSEFINIDETLLGRDTGLSADQTYDIFTNLQRQNILSYIPKLRTPYITFTRKRVDGERLCFPKEVYADRKESLKERIAAIIGYATGQNLCRSRFLLSYFGEKNEHDCKHCDVCNQKHPTGIKRGEYNEVHTSICNLLSDMQPHSCAQLEELHIRKAALQTVLRAMLDEEELAMSDGNIKLTKKT